ncbi:hypothetical protein SAMN05444391_1026 [Thermocrinis minervae]|uniref:Dephospho-CoA kinase n=2 Tax=Thermocrinis minervae TaxID=381751 RepID=A0A1M6SGT6_9AQUI|nr:hypothetical protein SAMN05444391_1026 [Thermocrinis minervae]
MQYDWKKYEDKLKALREFLEKADALSPEVEAKLYLPGEEGAEKDAKVPYILLCYYTKENVCHKRKIELFEYYLQEDLKDLISKITSMAEEFAMEIEHSEYGGG